MNAWSDKVDVELISYIGHEVRTPLNAIVGFAQLMSMDEQDPVADGHRRKLDGICEAAGRMLTIVDDILETARRSATADAGRWADTAPSASC